MNKHWTDKSKELNNLADRIAGLSPAKRALIELSLKQKGLVVSGEQRIPQREKRSSAPLSFAQQRLWFLNQLGTGSAYNTSMAIRLKGLPNIKALEDSLNEIIRRHEALRTTFKSAGGRPVQVIAQNISFKMPLIDLSGQPKAERAVEAERLARAEAMRRFDLVKGPLFKAALIRLSEEEHILLLTMHHIVSDGWSMGVFTAELAALYKAYCNGEASPLPELPIQYADFAHWQREWLQGEVLENQLSYWRNQLEGVSVLQLFTDRPRPPVQTFEGASQNIALSQTLTGALNDLSQRQGVTLFMTLLAAFQSLLFRYTGHEDIVVGSPIANRNREEVEGLIGFFVNTLALRTDLSGNPSFRELLGRVGEVAFGAFEHQDLPFEKLVEELHPERDMSRTPLFQIMFAHQNMPSEELQLPGLTLSSFPMKSITVRFDIEIHLWEKPEGLSGRVMYNTDLFDNTTIARLIGHYETLLENIVADADQRISDVQILTDAERQQLLVDWNNTSSKYPRDRCVHQLFEQQVEQSPDAVAVAYGDEQLTYQEINLRANQLAHYLRTQGIGPDTPVAILVERSCEMVVGWLGILKAGGAYVPMDPSYPEQRLALMLKDSNAPVLLTMESMKDRVPDYRGRILSLDSDTDELEGQPVTNPCVSVSATNLAYVIYTSGSTGRPKGVAIPHRAVNRLVCKADYLQLEASDRVAQASNASFDAATFEIWGVLLHGAQLVGVAREMTLNPKAFADFLDRQRITVMFITTALFNQMAYEAPGAFCGLRALLFGGEAVDPSWVRQVLSNGPPQRLLHVYGPTETTTFATWYEVKEVPEGVLTVPIGTPIANTQAYILDRDLQPVPIGIPGELYLSGDGLGRGYLNRPELTAEKFNPDPFSEDPAARLYKTGDLVRYLPDGTIEFLGRIDHQVKMRGFRIELGEVESVLGQHLAVEEAVVIAREDLPGDKRLVAYVVSSREPSPTFSELRRFLKEKLPDYMIPTAFGYLDFLPLTPNGKVDRRALPAPDVVRPELQEAFVAPRSQSEELVAGIWSNVLGVERIGVYDSFFELGGHSLLVVQIVSRIREVFELELTVRALFEAPTVAGLTERIETALRSDEGLQTYPLQTVCRDQDLTLSFAQKRLWFLNQLGTGSAYNIPLAIRLKGLPNIKALEDSLNEIIRRHEALRTTFKSAGGRPVQVIAQNISFKMPLIDLSGQPKAERAVEAERLTRDEAMRRFDLVKGPLFYAALIRLSEEEHILLLTMHHIVSDGWSMGVFTAELAALYKAFCNGEASPLPGLPIQYADFAHWQRGWLQGEVMENQLSYWRKQLEGVPVLQLFTDRPRPSVQTFEGASQNIALSPTLTGALNDLSQRQGVTLFMTLLAAFQTLLFRYTGQEDIVVGSPIANRNRTEIEGLIGFFVNSLAMRTDLSGNPSFRALLGRVREVALGAYAHQDLPFEKLVEELNPERDMSRTPLFQITFAIQNMPAEELQLSGLTLSSFAIETITARFDMEIHLREKPEGLSGRVVYNTDLFDNATIARLIGHYETLLESIVADPDQHISDVQILTDPERQQMLVDWNDTSSKYPRDRCVHELFEQQVEQSPDAVAVVYEDEQLTYRQLNTRANQLAWYLNKLGVGPEVLVGICLERSLEMVVGVLGVLKAGGAFVPLDPVYPAERLAFMLSDGQISVLLTQKRLVETLPVYDGDVIYLDNDVSAIAQESEENPTSGATPANLVYVIYTSGSTGKPKGVLIPHRALVNHNLAVARQYGLGSKDRVLQFASLSFDLAAEEIFPSLLNGATVVLRPDRVTVFFTELLQFMEREKLTVLNPPTAYWHEWVSELSRSKAQLPTSVRLVIPGGEKASKEKFAAWQKLVGNHVRWINGYGPTEATITATNFESTSLHEVQGSLSVPIGRPIANTRVYILNPDIQPVPIGVFGELHIGGAGLSRGYLNRPELTAENFIPDPFSEDPAARLYKTGDLARYLPDGSIEFLGRIDQQVKIRGFRIELGEVESVLGRHPAVEEAVVIAREDVPGDKRLVAYVVASREPTPTFSELRGFLKETLPDYMIPTALVFLDLLPLTPNGKVDRRALPKPDLERSRLETKFIAPRTPVEKILAKIWCEVLGLEHVGVHDNFFELGGHSLLATQVVSRICETFETDLSLRSLFENQTVADLAEVIENILITEIDTLSEEDVEKQLISEE